MLRKIFRMVNRGWQGVHEAALLLGVFSLVSQLMGLLRDRLLASHIGPSRTLDIYYAAFQIPDLIYISIASLASITVLMPFIVKRMDEEGKEGARKFYSDVLSGFVLMLVLVSIVVFILMPRLAHLVAPGFSGEELARLVKVSRIMLLSPIFMGLSNMFGTVTQLERKFFVFALSPILYNACLILGVVALYPRYGASGLAIGVALGSLIHMLVQVPSVIAGGFKPSITSRIRHASLRQVAATSLPRTLGISMNSIALLIVIAIGSTLGSGAISIFKFAINLETVPMGIIGTSYAVAVFPILSEAFAKGDKAKWEKTIVGAIRQLIFWSIPITALFIVLRAHVIRAALGAGVFSWSDTKLTAACFAIFAIGLIGQNLILVTVRAFYSAHNTKTPLYINAACSLVIVVGSYLLVKLWGIAPGFRAIVEGLLRVEDTPGTVVLMLPLAYMIGVLLNGWLHWRDLRENYLSSDGGATRTLWQSVLAALTLGISSYATLNIMAHYMGEAVTFWRVALQGSVATFVGAGAAACVLFLIGNEELVQFTSAIRQKFWKVDLVEPLKKPE